MVATLKTGQSLQVSTFEGGYDRNFCYLAWCPDSGIAALVDPATPTGPIQDVIREEGLDLKHILLTHTHSDHLTYLEEWLVLNPQLEVAGHQRPVRDDLPNYRGLSDGAVVDVGRCRIIVLETPGHFRDCICWYYEEGRLLFTGDTIFVGRTGRTIGSLSSTRELYHSIYDRILTLPSEITVLPGHNYGPAPTITLGGLKAGSDFFSCTNAAQFEEVMMQFERSRRRDD